MWYLRRLAGETPARSYMRFGMHQPERRRPGGNSHSKTGASIIRELLRK